MIEADLPDDWLARVMAEVDAQEWYARIAPAAGRGWYITYVRGIADIRGPWRSHAWTRRGAERKARRALAYLRQQDARRRESRVIR